MSTLSIALAGSARAEAYAGPMEVLLGLIRSRRYPIDALPVAEITALFLDYVRTHAMDEELGGEFMETASWLVLLKSRSMLPVRTEDAPSVAAEEELWRALVDYEQIKYAAEFLASRQPRFAGPQLPGGRRKACEERLPLTLSELIENTRRALETAHAARELAVVDGEESSIEEQMQWVLAQLSGQKVQSTAPWFSRADSESVRLLTLQALLELAARGRVLLHQRQPWGEILVKRI
jgi:segregation and condensation protein A